MIQFSGVSFRYSNRDTIINEISFQITPGEYLGIVGTNGIGKSTIAMLMNGLLLPTEGIVQYKDYCTGNEHEVGIIRKKIGMIFQNPENQIVASTLFEDIAFGLQNVCYPTDKISDRVMEALQHVGMQDYRDTDVNSLSGGQKQRVAIASILAMEPEVIIFDESTSMLDPEGKDQILKLMRELNQQGITIISITHDMEELIETSRILVLDQGKIRYDGTLEMLFEDEYLRIQGIATPFIVEARDALIDRRMPIPRSIFSMEDLVDYLWKLP
ncbi:MAG: energy-coupling factor transporter ATPase [Paenibacillaceae bacterium]